jgi:hypothetical protein
VEASLSSWLKTWRSVSSMSGESKRACASVPPMSLVTLPVSWLASRSTVIWRSM